MSNRGGARPGSGRKPIPVEQKKVMYTTKLEPTVVAYLRQLNNAAVTIETLVRRSKQFKDWREKQKET